MPTVADIPTFAAALQSLTFGTPLTHGAVTIVPLLDRAASEPDWLTLFEAQDDVTITEVTEAGTVAELLVTNAADHPVLLLDGEQLVGAKQNRILNTTVLVDAASQLTIPVSCVEARRWRYRSRRLSANGASLFASTRRKNAARVTVSLRHGFGHQGNQQDIWKDIAMLSEQHEVPSPTSALEAFFEKYEGALRAAAEALRAQPDQAGAVTYIGGAWAGLELLASPGLFARTWPQLLSGYVADGLGKPLGNGHIDPGAIISTILATPVEEAPAVGLGTEYRLRAPKAVGAALLVDDRVAHLVAFPG